MSAPQPSKTSSFINLPPGALVDPALGLDACPWLDSYVEFSRIWSPRGYEMFHEAVGLWVLSTVAARRLLFEFGGRTPTPLTVLLCCPTSSFAKTTTAKIGVELIYQAGMGHFMAPSDSTPEAFIGSMTDKTPENLAELEGEALQRAEDRMRFAGQRGWFHEEFGSIIQAVAKGNHYMSGFRELLRRVDDMGETYERETRGRGVEVVNRPYLALLGNTTPSDLRGIAIKNGKLWNDGFFARMAFISPAPGEFRGNERFPRRGKIHPDSLVEPIVEWHRDLGIPRIATSEDKKEAVVTHGAQTVLDLDDEVFEAAYTYIDGLSEAINVNPGLSDLAGNYTRQGDKALRIAGLFAGLSGDSAIRIEHWAKAQGVVERWRVGLHNVYDATCNSVEITEKRTHEEIVIGKISERGELTVREIGQLVRQLDTGAIQEVVDRAVRAGALIEIKSGRKVCYAIQPEGESDGFLCDDLFKNAASQSNREV